MFNSENFAFLNADAFGGTIGTDKKKGSLNPSQENELELKGDLLLDANSRMEDERWPESITVHGADRYIKFKISHSPEKHLEFSNAIQSSITNLDNGDDSKIKSLSMGDHRSSGSFSIKKKSKSFHQRNSMSRGSSMKDIMKSKHDLDRQSKSSSSLSSDSTTSSSSMKDVSSFFFHFFSFFNLST